MELRHYFTTFRKWLWLIILATVLPALVVFVLGSRSSPVYRATAGVAIVRQKATVSLAPEFRDLSEAELRIQDAQAGQARRNTLAALVLNGAIAEEVFETLKVQLPPYIQNPAGLLGRVNGGLVEGSDLIEITAVADEPELAATIANAWAAAYERLVNATYGSGVSASQVAEIERQAADSKEDYEAAKAALVSFLATDRSNELTRQITETQGIIVVLQNEHSDVFNEQVRASGRRFSDLHAARRRLARILDDARGLQEQVAAGGPQSAAGSSLALTLLKAQAFASSVSLPTELQLQVGALPNVPYFAAPVPSLVTELQLQVGALPNLDVDPQAQALDLAALTATLENRLDELDGKIAALYGELMTELPSDLWSAWAGADELKESEEPPASPTGSVVIGQVIGKLEGNLRQLQAQLEVEEATRRELTSALNLAWDAYSTLARKVEEVNIASTVTGTEVRFVSPALVPRSALRRPTFTNIAVAGIAGLMLALGVVFVIAYSQFLPEPAHSVSARDDHGHGEEHGQEIGQA